VLGRVYSDICEPSDPNFKGDQYFITFINKILRDCALFTLKSNYIVHELIKQNVNRAEAQTDKQVKPFVSDNVADWLSD